MKLNFFLPSQNACTVFHAALNRMGASGGSGRGHAADGLAGGRGAGGAAGGEEDRALGSNAGAREDRARGDGEHWRV